MTTELNENHGIWIPKAISSRIDISQTAKLVYGYINGFTANGVAFYASNKQIGEWVGVEADTVSTAICLLVKMGLINVNISKERWGSARSVTSVIPHTAESPMPHGEIPDIHTAESPNNNIVDNIDNTIVTASPIDSAEFDKAVPALESIANRKLKLEIARRKKYLKIYYPQQFKDWLATWKYNNKARETYVSWCVAVEKVTPDVIISNSVKYQKANPKFQTTPRKWLDEEMWKEAVSPEQAQAERRNARIAEIEKREQEMRRQIAT